MLVSFDGFRWDYATLTETPNLDRLARRGVTFTHAYNQGGYHGAVCVASRTMLVTGRFLWKAKADEGRLGEYVGENRLWPQLLQQAGYETFFTGKWHVGTQLGPVDYGFEGMNVPGYGDLRQDAGLDEP